MYGFEIFPKAVDEIDPRDVSFAGPMKINLRPCLLCGAGIFVSKMDTHISFHNELLEAINSRVG